MCFPALMAAPAVSGVMSALSVASTGISLIGGLQQARAQQHQYSYQAQLAEINAQQADHAARDALERGELDALAHGRQVAALRGQQRTSMAAQGLDLGFGTPLDLAVETDVMASEDAQRIRQNAGREADSYRINAQSYRNEAVGARYAGSASKSSMLINAGSTLIGGATQLGATWNKYGMPKRGY